MSRDVSLNVLKGGINRLRAKGGANPSSLYDLVNGYVAIDGSVRSRHGTQRTVALPAGTKGLVAFNGAMVVFSNVVTPITTAGYSCAVLVDPNDAKQAIKEIHFAAPFMGYLYVVAEFANGDVFHYWLQGGTTWTADTVYHAGVIVTPSTPNGMAYKAVRAGAPLPSWSAAAKHATGDQIEPTVYNDFYYRAVNTLGANPSSGAIEPAWPVSEGAQVNEDTETTPFAGVVVPSTQPPGAPLPRISIRDRYATFGTENL